MKYLITFDMFGMQYHFLRNGNVKNKTKVGLFLTLIYLILVLALFLGFGIDLYTRKNPKVSLNSLVKSYDEKILTNNQFIYAYRIENDDGVEIRDDSIIELQFMYFRFKLIDGQWQSIKYEMNLQKTRCSDIPNIKEKELYYNTSLKNWYCVDFENQTLGGFWDGDFVNFFGIQTKQCENSTANNFTCQSQEKIIKSFLSNTTANYYFSYLYMEAMPTLDDYNQPLKSSLINRYEMLDTKISKKHIHRYKETAINDDRGWIFSDVILQSIYASDNIQYDFRLKDENKESILFIYYIYFGKRYEVYNRSYMKVQEVIASIGGFSKFFHLIVSLLYGYLSDIFKNFDLTENCFNNINQSIYILDDNKLEMNNTSKMEMNITKSNHHIKFISKKRDLNINSIMKIKLCCKKISSLSKEQKINIIEYESINKYHNHKLDITTYLKLFKDFNLIKKLLLDDTQQKALDVINNKYIIDEPVNIDLFLPKLKEYINNSNNMSEVNRKLFSFLQLDEVKYNNLIYDCQKIKT